MIDELTLYNLEVKYHNLKDIANAIEEMVRVEVIEEFIKTIVNTPTKIKIEHYRENDILVNRQNEIIDMLIQLKEQK